MNTEAFVSLLAKYATKRRKSTNHAGLRLVLLNACNSATTAKKLNEVTSIQSIGASGRITDDAARAFSKQFWSDVFAGRTVSEAYEKAKTHVDLAAAGETSESGRYHLYNAAGEARLAHAVCNYDVALLKRIVAMAPQLLNFPLNSHGESFMTLAAKYGNKNAITVGVQSGLVNQLKDGDNPRGVHTTPLHTAMYYGQLETMIMLLSSDDIKSHLVSRGGVKFFQMAIFGADKQKAKRHQIYGALAKLSESNEWDHKVGLNVNELAEQLMACPYGGLEKLKAHYNEDPELATVFPGIVKALRIEPATPLTFPSRLPMRAFSCIVCGAVLLLVSLKRAKR